MFLATSASEAPDYITHIQDWRFFDWLSRNNPESANHRIDLARPGALRSGRNHYIANFPDFFGAWATTPNCKVPTLGIYTTGDDEYTRMDQMSEAGRFVEAPFTFWNPEGTHWPQLDQTEAFNARLLEFFAVDEGAD